MKCKVCGFAINENDKFCTNCGTSIGKEFHQENQNSNAQQITRNVSIRNDDAHFIINVFLIFTIVMMIPLLFEAYELWIEIIEYIKLNF